MSVPFSPKYLEIFSCLFLVVLSNLKSNNNYGEIVGILRANSADDLKTKLFIHEVTQGVLKPRIKF